MAIKDVITAIRKEGGHHAGGDGAQALRDAAVL